MRNTHLRTVLVLGLCFAPAALAGACSDDSSSSTTSSGGSGGTGGATVTTTTSATASGGNGGTGGATASTSTGTTVDCSSATTNIDKVVCAANGLLASLPANQLSLVNLAFTDTVSRTKWSNLPGVDRAGVKMGALSAESQADALAMMQVVLSTNGMDDLNGVRAADDYLASVQGGGMGAYSSDNYSVAVFGTPAATGSWSVLFGGHHMAFMVTYVDGVGYPVPNHLGVEPKASFTIDGGTWAPMAEEGDAMVAIFSSLSDDDLGTAYLSGQKFSDVVIGPVEYGTGSSDAAKAKYPTGGNRTGVLVSSLDASQQALVTAAIQQWAGDFDPAVSDSLIAAYTTDAAYQDTYVAWGGTEADGVDPDVDGTYMRIDGPRVWIEVACQAGVVIQGKTHYHSIYRDKQFDYGATL